MHHHTVQRPGQDSTEMPCYLDSENPCRFAVATPEELGLWLSEKDENTRFPFSAWLQTHRMPPAVPAKESGVIVHQSVSEAIRFSLENPKKTQTVPVTVENPDGKKWVVGEAEVEVRDNGDVVTTAKLNYESIRMHVPGFPALPLSISTVGFPPPPSKTLPKADEIQIRHHARGYGKSAIMRESGMPCQDLDCEHIEVHNHGAACTSSCSCNRYGRSD